MISINYICPYWGQEGTDAAAFLARVVDAGYDGVEINLPEDDSFVYDFQKALANIRSVKDNFIFIAQQVLSFTSETPDAYSRRMTKRLELLMSFKPDFINSHTGKDYYSFEDNCRIIEAAENVAVRFGIPVLHETHRARFTFHASSLLPYLKKFPSLKLTGDFSHWCTVSESLLNDQDSIVEKIIPHVAHLHARVGHEHSPQVNNPFAPEWSQHVERFVEWWKKVVEVQSKTGSGITLTPEFGPVPYMPTLPYSQEPLSDQWKLNVQMKEMLRQKLIIA